MAVRNTQPPERGEHILYPGQMIRIERNKMPRPAHVLAVTVREALVEYFLPRGTTGLVVVSRWAESPVNSKLCRRIPYGYMRMPKKWLLAILRAGTSWEGASRSGQVPHPWEVLKKRFPDTAAKLREGDAIDGRDLPEVSAPGTTASGHSPLNPPPTP